MFTISFIIRLNLAVSYTAMNPRKKSVTNIKDTMLTEAISNIREALDFFISFEDSLLEKHW